MNKFIKRLFDFLLALILFVPAAFVLLCGILFFDSISGRKSGDLYSGSAGGSGDSDSSGCTTGTGVSGPFGKSRRRLPKAMIRSNAKSMSISSIRELLRASAAEILQNTTAHRHQNRQMRR